jgi:hypothetical protein
MASGLANLPAPLLFYGLVQELQALFQDSIEPKDDCNHKQNHEEFQHSESPRLMLSVDHDSPPFNHFGALSQRPSGRPAFASRR